LGAELVRRTIQVARDEKLSKIVGDILPDNTVMRRVCEKLGFALQGGPDEEIVKAEMTL
jgi:acetyltransferase